MIEKKTKKISITVNMKTLEEYQPLLTAKGMKLSTRLSHLMARDLANMKQNG